MFRDAALQKHGALVGVEAYGKPIDHHLIHILFNNFAAFIVRGQGVPICDEVVALHLRLQTHPVFQSAVVVA